MQNNEKPLVSVVIPCYNHEKFVKDCIQSVIDQTYENIELIIIDDGSKDNSVHKIQEMVSLCEKRFTRFEFRHRLNKGLCNTLNEAIEWCKGEYFAVIASDDMLLPDKTSFQIEFMKKNKDIVALFGSANYIDENNNITAVNQLVEKQYVFDKILLNDCPFYAPTQMIQLDILKRIGGYDPEILVEDWYMWLKLAQVGRVFCLSETLALYRIHSTNSTKNSKFIYENNLKTLSLYKDHKLYFKAYSKLRWTYIIWSGQENKIEALKLLYGFIKEYPSIIFSKNFIVFWKYFILKIKNWF